MSGQDNLTPINEREDHKELSAKGGKNKKGSKNLTTLLRSMMAMTLLELGIVKEGDPRAKLKADSELLKKLIGKAVEDGNDRSITEVIDRLEGKPIFTQRLEAEGLEKIVVEIVSGPNKENQGDDSPTEEPSSQD